VVQDVDVDAGKLALGRGVAKRILVGEPHADVALILNPLERALGAGDGRARCRQPDTDETCDQTKHHGSTSHRIVPVMFGKLGNPRSNFVIFHLSCSPFRLL
jgi:hypothetical protein